MSQSPGRAEEVRLLESLARIEASPALGSGDRLAAMLRHLVREEIEGRGERIKAYTVATEILGRPADFDPQADSIVRVEMGRLRKALEFYYATEGRDDPVVISFEKGSYRPSFDFKAKATETPVAEERPPRILPYFLGFGAFLVIGSVLLAAWMFYALPQPRHATTPLLVLPPVETAADAPASPLSAALQSELAAELSEQPWLTVVLAASDEQALAVAARPDQSFVARVRYSAVAGEYSLSVILLRARTQAVVWSGRYSGPLAQAQSYALVHELAAAIARDVGAPEGAIVRLAAGDSAADAASSEAKYGCLLAARRYWLEFRAADGRAAEECLTPLVRAHADFAEGRAVLAMLRIEAAQRTAGPEREAALVEAESLLRGAGGPEVMTLNAKLGLAACRGEIESVRALAEKLVQRAPNNPDVLGDVGSKLGLVAGDWTRALDLEKRAAALNRLPAPWYPLATAAKAAIDRDWSRALSALSDTPQRRYLPGQAMLLAAAAMADAPMRGEGARARLRELGIGSREAAIALVDGQCWSENAKEAFREGLRKASF